MEKISIKTQRKNEMVEITKEVNSIIESKNIKEGICVLFCPHTTAGITINEACDSSVKGDILFSMNKISPDYKEFRHLEGNSDAHVKTTLTGNSISLIINEGKIMLGHWQGIYFSEYDGPRKNREILLQIIEK